MCTETPARARPSPTEDRRPGCTLALLRLARAGDAEAVERLLAAHKGLVKRWVKLYAGDRGGQTPDEMEAAGMEGLWRAVREFDEARGCQFSTFAVWCIRGAMKPDTSQARQHNSEQAGALALALLGVTLDDAAVVPPDAGPRPDLPLLEAIAPALAALPPRMRTAVRMRFGMERVAGEPYVARARVGALSGRALRLLRIPLTRLLREAA